MSYKFHKLFYLDYPQEFVQHEYDAWRNHVGLQLFNVLLEQKYPCIVDITEEEENRYARSSCDPPVFQGDKIEQGVTITIDLKAIDIQRLDQYSMYQMDAPNWMAHKKKSFWDKWRFWKR